MILTEKQYEQTKDILKDLNEALELTIAEYMPPDWVKEAEIEGLKGEIDQFESDIANYEILKSGSVRFRSAYTLEELRKLLPQIRISSGMSQEEFAKGVKLNLQKYLQMEDYGFYAVDDATIEKIASILGVKVNLPIWKNLGILDGIVETGRQLWASRELASDQKSNSSGLKSVDSMESETEVQYIKSYASYNPLAENSGNKIAFENEWKDYKWGDSDNFVNSAPYRLSS